MKKITFLLVTLLLFAGCGGTSGWTQYANENYKVSFQFPGNFTLMQDESMGTGIDGKEWYRIEIVDSLDPKSPRMRFELNPDGYGPWFPDKAYKVTETEDGTVEIGDVTELETDEGLKDGLRWIITTVINSKNGNAYHWHFFYTGDSDGDEIYEPIFKEILGTFRFE